TASDGSQVEKLIMQDAPGQNEVGQGKSDGGDVKPWHRDQVENINNTADPWDQGTGDNHISLLAVDFGGMQIRSVQYVYRRGIAEINIGDEDVEGDPVMVHIQ